MIRRELGNKPITISSGFRSKADNIEAGGAKASKHLKGWAADINVASMTPHEVYKILDKTWLGGLGRYQTHVHLDIRHVFDEQKQRWIV